MHLILSPTWLTKDPSKEKPGMFNLNIHKAITFHRGGVTYLDEFKKPRRVTYFMNYMTEYVTSGYVRDDVVTDMEVGHRVVEVLNINDTEQV